MNYSAENRYAMYLQAAAQNWGDEEDCENYNLPISIDNFCERLSEIKQIRVGFYLDVNEDTETERLELYIEFMNNVDFDDVITIICKLRNLLKPDTISPDFVENKNVKFYYNEQ